jgi:glycolate oxidase iron-sulfur subunit
MDKWNESLAKQLQNTLDEDQLTQCMRCGFCLPACPTYRETGFEGATPRGRIALMKAVYDGQIKPDQNFINQIDLCLGCRACEPACPAGVPYGQLLEQTRAAIHQERPGSKKSHILQQILLRDVISHPRRLKALGSLLRLYQRSGMPKWINKVPLYRLLPEPVREMERILPDVESPAFSPGTRVYPSSGKKSGRVGLFLGCVMDVLFNRTHRNTIRLLTSAGYEVVVPGGQNCCGALHAHAGDREQAIRLAKQNIQAFAGAKVDFICSNAGGCGAMLAEYAELFKEEPNWREQALEFQRKVKDVSELILEQADSGLITFSADRHQRITYQDSCHLINGMRVFAPRTLLKQVKNTTFVELKEANRCCGSAGIYNLLQTEMANRLLDEKMNHVKNTQADLLITSNPGCFLQMALGVKRAGLQKQIKVMHLADYLASTLQPGAKKQKHPS